MSAVQDTLQTVNLLLFLASVPAHIVAFRAVVECNKPYPLKCLVGFLCVAAIILSCLFVFLQFSWAANRLMVPTGVGGSWAWLVFDYLLASYLLCVAGTVKIYCNWRGRLRNSNVSVPPARRMTDVSP